MQAFVFDGEHALRYGVNEAIMLHHIIFWIDTNAANKQNFFEGRYWTYNSIPAFAEQFPFWSKPQIKRLLKSLQDKGVIMVGNFNKNSYDKTHWYALTDTFYESEQSRGENCLTDGTKSSLRQDESIPPIPDNNTDSNTDRNHIVDTKMQNLQFGQNGIPSTNSQKAQAQPNPPVPATPLPFKSARFAELWGVICKMPKWKNKQQYALNLSLKKLSKYSEAVAIRALETAIENGWQGVFPKTAEEEIRQETRFQPQPATQEEKPKYRTVTMEEILGGKKK